MSSQKAILGIALVFFLGVITGIGLSIRLVKVRTHAIASGTPQELAQIVTKRLGAELRLDPKQRLAVQKSAEETLLKISKLYPGPSDLMPLEAASREQIKAILTPEQREAFERQP